MRHLAGWSGEARNGLPIGRVTRHPERDSEGSLGEPYHDNVHKLIAAVMTMPSGETGNGD